MSSLRGTLQTFADMKQRCLNPRHPQFKNYGARGITICDAWLNSSSQFVKDMGLRPRGMTIERIDNNGNYEPSNCRWATRAEQRVNQRTCVFLEYNGKRMTIAEWARKIGRHETTLRSRIKAGWPLEYVLNPNVLLRGRCSDPHPFACAINAAMKEQS